MTDGNLPESKNQPLNEDGDGAIALVQTSVQGYQGPLPPPQHLREYNDILPGLAKTIVDEMQREARHRREVELTVVKTSAKIHIWSPFLGIVVLLVVVVSALISIYLGHAPIAWLFGAAAVVGALGVLVHRMRQNNPTVNRRDFLVPTNVDGQPASKPEEKT